MDIAKYIAQYLLKNKYCTIPGLGILTIEKTGAQESDGQLTAGQYRVDLSSVGAIDDGFPNFIAKIEQVSISKSSNEISRFVAESKAALQNGEEIIIPAVGKFIMQNGKQHFITDPNMQYIPPAIPVVKIATKPMEEKKAFEPLNLQENIDRSAIEENNSQGSINWGKVFFTLIGLAIVIIGGIYLFNYLSNKSATPVVNEASVENTTPATTPIVADSTLQNNAALNDSTAALNTTPTTAGGQQNVILNTYNNQAAADRRANKLKDFGNNVSVVNRDSSWYVVLPVSNAADTVLLDSLRRLYNPKEGVRVLN